MDLLTLHEIAIARAAPKPRPEDTDEFDDDLDMMFSVLVGSSENRTIGCWQRRDVACWFIRSRVPAAPDP